MLTVPTEHLGFGSEISETTRHGIEVAVAMVANLAVRSAKALS
jgi:hypothetical protein